MTRLDKIRERKKLATPGPWKWDGESDIDAVEPFSEIVRGDGPICPYGIKDENNALFIANAPDDIEWFLDKVNRMKESMKDLIQHADARSGFSTLGISIIERPAIFAFGDAGRAIEILKELEK